MPLGDDGSASVLLTAVHNQIYISDDIAFLPVASDMQHLVAQTAVATKVLVR